jgi:hypothetical protein
MLISERSTLTWQSGRRYVTPVHAAPHECMASADPRAEGKTVGSPLSLAAFGTGEGVRASAVRHGPDPGRCLTMGARYRR